MLRSRKSRELLDETESLRTAAPRSSPLGAIVRVVGARAAPTEYRLGDKTCLVGADASCDVVIDNASVSRQHVELGLVPEGISVRDLGSRNGTFFLGQRVQSISLAPGSRIQVGLVEVALDADIDTLQAGPAYTEPSYREIIGASQGMRALFGALVRLEGSLVSVLINGESGVGKELVARALHEGSSVARGPLVVLNCGAIQPELVASELFGHRRGAFTGASEVRRGAFESANGGTLFLDELGELPIEVQPMLLRALESGEIRPVGADRAEHVHVRVIAATNRDLRKDVQSRRFREDLFYRLAVVELTVPPLRERIDDIDALVARFASASGLNDVPPEALAQLRLRRWPGNVRELRNVVQAYAALGRLPPDALGPETRAGEAIGMMVDVMRPYADQKDALIEQFTTAYLEQLMAHTDGNQSAAARLSGLDRSWLWRLLVKHGLVKR